MEKYTTKDTTKDTIRELFMKTDKNAMSQIICRKITNNEWESILHNICHIREINNDMSLVVNYNYFKYFATKETYSIIVDLIVNNIDVILKTHKLFTVYLNMQFLSVKEIEKHHSFFYTFSKNMEEKYPDNLNKCYVYNAPAIITQLFNIISLIVHKDTLKKVELVK